MNLRLLHVVALPAILGAAACSTPDSPDPKTPTVHATKRADGTIDDHSMCDYKGHADREASEVAGPGFIQPNVRRVYQIVGSGEDRHKILICREMDTNGDGIKDIVRRYNDKGESVSEEADSNYDGKIDTWITFVKGRLAEVILDTNFDGKPDEWKFYQNGKLIRVERDTKFTGKPDVWEIYNSDGHLERMGVDVDGDGHVDRWDHDTEMRRRFEDAERKKDEAETLKAQKKAQEEKEASDKLNEGADDSAGTAKAPPESSKRKQQQQKKKPPAPPPGPPGPSPSPSP